MALFFLSGGVSYTYYRVRHKSVNTPVRHKSVNTPVRHKSVNTPVRHKSVNTPLSHEWLVVRGIKGVLTDLCLTRYCQVFICLSEILLMFLLQFINFMSSYFVQISHCERLLSYILSHLIFGLIL
jgi:hypothetical protein